MHQYELVPKEVAKPDIYDLLALSRGRTSTEDEIRSAHVQASKKKMRAEKSDGEAAREVGKSIDRARDVFLSPEALTAYHDWRYPKPEPAARASESRSQPAPMGQILFAGGAAAAILAVVYACARALVMIPSSGQPATPSAAASRLPVIPGGDVAAGHSNVGGVDPLIASRRESDAAKDINNALAAEVGTAMEEQRRGKLSAAQAAALRQRLKQKASVALQHADAAAKLDPTNDAAAYEGVAALYYSDDFTGAYRRVQTASARFPANSDLKAIKTLIVARMH